MVAVEVILLVIAASSWMSGNIQIDLDRSLDHNNEQIAGGRPVRSAKEEIIDE